MRKLAAATGETVAAAVLRATEERLRHIQHERPGRSVAAEILEIGKRCAALPDLDRWTPDEILGYDDHGLSS